MTNEERRAYCRAYYRKNPGKQAAATKRYRRKHPEMYRAAKKRYKLRHPEKCAIISKRAIAKWRSKNKERLRDLGRLAYHRNIQKSRKKSSAKMRARRKKYPDKVHAADKLHKSRRRAAIFGNGGRHTTAQWLEKLSKIGMKCIYCHKKLTFKTLTKDHVLPLSKGGTDDIENIIPSCLRCNQAKSSKLLDLVSSFLQ